MSDEKIVERKGVKYSEEDILAILDIVMDAIGVEE